MGNSVPQDSQATRTNPSEKKCECERGLMLKSRTPCLLVSLPSEIQACYVGTMYSPSARKASCCAE